MLSIDGLSLRFLPHVPRHATPRIFAWYHIETPKRKETYIRMEDFSRAQPRQEDLDNSSLLRLS